MDCTFKQLTLHNFMSFEHEVLDLTNRGMVLVLGKVLDSDTADSNGAGKSALMCEAINWVLYDNISRSGKRSSKVKRLYHGEVVDAETYVQLVMEVSGTEVVLRKSVENGIQVTVAGREGTPYSKTEGMKYIQDMIGIPYHLFNSIVMMGQGFPCRFTGFSDSERTSVIEDFIDSQIYSEAGDRANETVKAMSSFLQQTSMRREHLYQSIQQTGLSHTHAMQNQINRQQEIEKIKEQLTTNIEALLDQIEEVRSQRDQLNEQSVTVEMSEEHNAAHAKHYKAVQKIAECQAEAVAIRRRSKQLQEVGDECPTCLQKVNKVVVKDHRDKMHVEADGYDIQVAAMIIERDKLAEELRVHGEVVAKLQEQHHELTTERRMTEQRLSQMEAEARRMTGELDSLEHRNDYDTTLASLEQRLVSEKQQLAECDEQIVETETLLPYVSWWVEGYSVRGIRSMRLDEVLTTLNERLKEYSYELFDADAFVRLVPEKVGKKTNKSCVSVEVSSAAGSYEMMSGGQRRKVDLALHLSLRDLAQRLSGGFTTNLMVCDEILDHLDRPSSERVIGLLDRIGLESTFIISHERSIQTLIPQTLTIQYHDHCSSVV